MEHVAESINYDYLPGEPESRKVWYITLRFPPSTNTPGGSRGLCPSRNGDTSGVLNLGEIIKTNGSSEYSGKALTTLREYSPLKDGFFRVVDIHGRNIVIEPSNPSRTFKLIKLNEHPLLSEFDLNLKGVRNKNAGYKTLYSSESNDYFPRVGKYQYPPRPYSQTVDHNMFITKR